MEDRFKCSVLTLVHVRVCVCVCFDVTLLAFHLVNSQYTYQSGGGISQFQGVCVSLA